MILDFTNMESKKNEVSGLLEYCPQPREQLYRRWKTNFPKDPPISQLVFNRILVFLETEGRAEKIGTNLYCRRTIITRRPPQYGMGYNGPTVVRIICPQPMTRDKK